MSRNHTGRDETGAQGWSPEMSRKWRKIIAAQLPLPCVNPRKCGGALVYPDQLWDVGHIGDALQRHDHSPESLGPAHRACNRSDGGRQGAQISNAKRKTKERKLQW